MHYDAFNKYSSAFLCMCMHPTGVPSADWPEYMPALPTSGTHDSSESDAQSGSDRTECAGMHMHAKSTGRDGNATSAQECTHDLDTRMSQDECTRMHTNAYAYTTACTVHYDAL